MTGLAGFLFPFRGFTPAIDTGILSKIVLALAVGFVVLRYAAALAFLATAPQVGIIQGSRT
jgi:hypothetical protein